MSRAGRSKAQRARRNARRRAGGQVQLPQGPKSSPVAMQEIAPELPPSPVRVEVLSPRWRVHVKVKNRRRLTKSEEWLIMDAFSDQFSRLKGRKYWLTVEVRAGSSREARRRARETVRVSLRPIASAVRVARRTDEPVGVSAT